MKRREFLLASGSAILTGTAIGSLQRPALGLEFEISAVPSKKPMNIDSILIEFTNFDMTPTYLDERMNHEIVSCTVDETVIEWEKSPKCTQYGDTVVCSLEVSKLE